MDVILVGLKRREKEHVTWYFVFILALLGS